MTVSVLVTDGENRSSLAVTRSLGKKGYRVVVTAGQSPCLASVSKYCSRFMGVGDPLRESNNYADNIKRIAEKENIDFILPMTDASIHLLNQIRSTLPSKVVLACPTAEKMKSVSDKLNLFKIAEKLNVPIPRTRYLSGRDDIYSLVNEIDYYPAVIKPALSRTPEGLTFLSGGVRYAASQRDLEQIYTTSKVLQYPSMIQEKIIGAGTGLFTLYDSDRHLALFSHRRLLEKPPSGGVSVVSESVPLDEEMVENAGRLLSAVGWRGVAMVEFKRDQRDGKAKLIEINGRFWGTLQLAVTCNVDFPKLYLDYLQGKYPANPIREYRLGHKMKWFFGTLDHLLIRSKSRGEKLYLPADVPSRWKVLIDFLKVKDKNTSFDVIDRNDLGPFLLEARNYFLDAVSRG